MHSPLCRTIRFVTAGVVASVMMATAFAAAKKKKKSPPPPASASESSGSATIQLTYADVGRFLVTIEYESGGRGAGGSGFLIKREDGVYLVTNQHVLMADKKATLRLQDGTPLKVERFVFAKDRDIAMCKISDATDGFQGMERPQDNVRIGEPVAVLGNSKAQGVMTELPGKLLAVGPVRVEVDAKWVGGNSGGPIILSSKAQVIGVTTYSSQKPLSELEKDAPFSGIRRFGVRIDNIAEWETRDLNTIRKEAAAVEAIKSRTKSIKVLVDDITRHGAITLSAYQGADNPLRKLANDYVGTMQRGNMDEADRKNIHRRFLIDLFSNADITRIEAANPSYTSHEALEGHKIDRTNLRKDLERIANDGDFAGKRPAKKSVVKPYPFPLIR